MINHCWVLKVAEVFELGSHCVLVTHEVDGVVVHHDHAHVDGDESDNDAHRKKREG